MKTTIIVAHPNWQESKAIKRIVEEIKNRRTHVDIRILDQKGNFNVEEEQRYLLQYDNIVYAFPFWWYSFPWTLKKYFDDILQVNFAFSFSGDASKFKLRGKKFSYIVSTGNKERVYQEGKGNLHTIKHFLDSLNGIFHLLSTGGVMLHDKAFPFEEYMFEPTIFYSSEIPEIDKDKAINEIVENFIKKI